MMMNWYTTHKALSLETARQILEVPEGADSSIIRDKYREKARKYHPDFSKTKATEPFFTDITEAYDVLNNNKPSPQSLKAIWPNITENPTTVNPFATDDKDAAFETLKELRKAYDYFQIAANKLQNELQEMTPQERLSSIKLKLHPIMQPFAMAFQNVSKANLPKTPEFDAFFFPTVEAIKLITASYNSTDINEWQGTKLNNAAVGRMRIYKASGMLDPIKDAISKYVSKIYGPSSSPVPWWH